ncbi:helix-turn-helix transcriptional regulator [Catenulispora pinisilvae]|uniref:helix-turn-helix transcriptional regulator n=1 Tax=Catenulispora pinisilvae TaxID=2705253 RepID=UPI001890ED4D|nr:helix-turn-helix domain-containing protein [Catenulispora pinisilvae]
MSGRGLRPPDPATTAHRAYRLLAAGRPAQADPVAAVASGLDVSEDEARAGVEWLGERSLLTPDDGAVALPEHAVLDVLAQARGGLGRMAEEVERWRGAVADLADLVSGAPPSFESERVEVLRFTDRAQLRHWLDDRAPLNRQEAVAMHPALAPNDVLRESLKVDLELLRRGVGFRMLVSRTAARRAGAGAYLSALERTGGQVRVADAIPLQMLVLDGSVVVTPGADAEEPCDVVIRSAVVGRCLLAAFEHLWVGAEKYATFVGAGGDQGEELTAVHVRLLRALATGAKDEAIARQLGCSERTLRRLVAQTLETLGVRSRFAAGARAAQLGLLD